MSMDSLSFPTLPSTYKFVNVQDYRGCDPTGVSDSTSAFAKAITRVAQQIGPYSMNVLYIPPGIYKTDGFDLSGMAGFGIIGGGSLASIWSLKNGANKNLIQAYPQNINFSGTFNNGPGPGTNAALHDFFIRDITLDGNRGGQTSGPSYVIQWYAYGYSFQNVIIEHGFSGGIQCDYYGPFPDQNIFFGTSGNIEVSWVGFKSIYNNGIGIQISGPSDGQLTHIVSAENLSHNIHLLPNSTGYQISNSHFWFPGQGSPAPGSVCALVEAGTFFNNCVFEGSDSMQVVVNAQYCRLSGEIFSFQNGAGLQVGQQAGVTPYAQSINQSAGLTTATFPNFIDVDMTWHNINHANGNIWFNQQVVASKFRGIIDSAATVNPIFNGTPYTGNIIHIAVNDGGRSKRYFYQQNTTATLESATAPDPGNGGTVAATNTDTSRVNPTGASRTGCILQAGTVPGQEVWVVNENATNTISWATQATSNIAGEAGGTFVLAGNRGQKFKWDSPVSLWFKAS